jgi:hypothetical protein
MLAQDERRLKVPPSGAGELASHQILETDFAQAC